MAQLIEISTAEFLRRWPLGAADEVTLLDVREPAEWDLAKLADSTDIPMNEVPARLAEIDRDRPVVVMCHGGARSRQVAEYLLTQGFDEVFNLAGGIDAWSREVDPGVPRY